MKLSPCQSKSLWQTIAFAIAMGMVLLIEPEAIAAQKEKITGLRSPQNASDTYHQWLSQALVRVTNVRLNLTADGVEVILESAKGAKLSATTRAEGNTFIAEIPKAVLALPQQKEFRTENPTAGITSVAVTQLDAQTIQVQITGETVVPTANVIPNSTGLVVGVTPATEEELEIVVTGNEETGYRVPDASTATRTDTPIRDLPFSVEVVPDEVIEDQRALRLTEALRNVSGVALTSTSGNRNEYTINIRGFSGLENQFKDGFSENSYANRTFVELSNIERIEVLKGPASGLYGRADPSGAIGLITKKPLPFPYYATEFTAGSYDFYRPTLDLSGPLNQSRNLMYRLNLAYENAGSFRNFVESERYFAAPSLAWNISPDTTLTLQGEYIDDTRTYDRGLVAIGDRVANIPISRYLGFPPSLNEVHQRRGTAFLDHRFSENLSLRSAFRATFAEEEGTSTEANELLPDNRTLTLTTYRGYQYYETYAFRTDLIGKFTTGSIQHTALLGLDLSRQFTDGFFESGDAGSIDIFNPVYESTIPPLERTFDSKTEIDTVGVYLQDQITLAENLKLLLGGRLDFIDTKDTDNFTDASTSQSDRAFSPRVGIVYQPIPDISLYANFSQSFLPNSGRSANNSPFDPERGTQYEVGVKADLLGGRLSSTLAFYQITKTNVLTTDPNDDLFSVQTGEQRSRGIELDVAGEISPGWNIIASFAYIDAVITEDNTFPVGNRLDNVPDYTASLWTTYRIQSGDLEGLGFGAGVFFAGESQGDLENTFTLPAYAIVNAAIYYDRGNFRAALNFKNLFDTEYFVGTQGSRTQVDPGAPFTVLGTVGVEF
jgi:iron complex outermembrane recepter protein